MAGQTEHQACVQQASHAALIIFFKDGLAKRTLNDLPTSGSSQDSPLWR